MNTATLISIIIIILSTLNIATAEDENIIPIQPALNLLSPSTISGTQEAYNYTWKVIDNEEQGMSSMSNNRAFFNKNHFILQHSFEGNDNILGSAIQSSTNNFGIGEYIATVKLPNKTDAGIVSAFFLYYQENYLHNDNITTIVHEIDFEFLPGLDSLQVGTYSNWIEEEHGFSINLPYRDVKVIPRLNDIFSWQWGKVYNLKIVKDTGKTILYISNEGSSIYKELWRTENTGSADGAPVEVEQYVIFNIWHPDPDEWNVGPTPENQSMLTSMEIHNFTFTPKEDTSSPGDTCSSGPQTVMWEGKEWQRCDDGNTYDLDEAEDYCRDLILDGYSDWELPPYTDLQGLVHCTNDAPGDSFGCEGFMISYGPYDIPTISSEFECTFHPASSNEYTFWTTDTNGIGIDFYDGSSELMDSNDDARVRCVRD